MNNLTISPLDNRYSNKLEKVKMYFSESSFFKYRSKVEIEYFIDLSKIISKDLDLEISGKSKKYLRDIYKNFNIEDYNTIKKIEKKINHDVKSIEYWLQDKFKNLNLEKFITYIHFGLTSQDINNTANSLSIKDYITYEYLPSINNLINILTEKINKWDDIVILSHTHGQPAVPSKMGKELQVFKYRLNLQLEHLKNAKYYGKFGGASGNLNAHKFSYPEVDWEKFGEEYMKNLGLIRSKYTTQIDNYDNYSYIFDCLKRINTIFIDFCQDIWLYISMNYFNQKIKEDEVGSSTMPHKVNPINFENAEGNLKLANTLLEFFSRKLPVSRLQRDLTDSTVLRNIGVIFGHIELSFNNICRGLNKLMINKDKIEKDLNDNFIVISEGIQVLLKRHGYKDAYEKLKKFSRKNTKIDKDTLNMFILSLDIKEEIKIRLLNLDVHNYI